MSDESKEHTMNRKSNRRRLVAAACLGVAAWSAGVQAQALSFLVREWMKDGDRFCQYDNGTVLNVGVRLCPLNIKVSP